MNATQETKRKRPQNSLTDATLAAVRIERIKHGLTAAELAKRIGYSHAAVRHVLAGRPMSGVRAKIEEFFGRPFWSKPGEWQRRN
jgi:transcriptional regulator with XRE-family HTH domain